MEFSLTSLYSLSLTSTEIYSFGILEGKFRSNNVQTHSMYFSSFTYIQAILLTGSLKREGIHNQCLQDVPYKRKCKVQ
jgi:hypothetical protein